jgi:amidohydrolase
MTGESAKEAVRKSILGQAASLIDLSHKIHANPELMYQERMASAWLADALSEGGLSVEREACALPTAFVARTGTGPLHVAICAEYDALPKVGHACGHNIIAAAAVGAGITLVEVAEEIGLTVSVIGTPAEEGGGGKIFLLERGAFEGVHAAMMVHPAPTDVSEPHIIAAQRIEIEYHGREAHASAYPQAGVNAADAITIAQVAIGLMRQHIPDTHRVHGIVTKGGEAPNIVPAHTTASYSIRARTVAELEDLRTKVLRCFEAGAIATSCELESRASPYAYAEMRHDSEMAAIYRRNAEAVGRRFVGEGPTDSYHAGSTDMGNVSLAVPSIHPMIGINSGGASNHQAEFAQHCVSESGDKAVIDGAVLLAWTAIDAASDDRIREHLLSHARRRVK